MSDKNALLGNVPWDSVTSLQAGDSLKQSSRRSDPDSSCRLDHGESAELSSIVNAALNLCAAGNAVRSILFVAARWPTILTKIWEEE